jgi:hypothetical protein
LIAQTLGHLRGAFNIAEQDRDGAVWGGMGPQVGPFDGDGGGHGTDRGPDVY